MLVFYLKKYNKPLGFLKHIFKSRSCLNEIFCVKIKPVLGFTPMDISHYEVAFTHPSLQVKTDEGLTLSYERLEYLGDAMLGSIIAHHLYEAYPEKDEGFLTQMRSKIVSRAHLNDLGQDLGLIDFLNTKTSKEKLGSNIHGNLLEALIGAIYLDRGYDYCFKFIHKKIIDVHVDIERLENKISSYKGHVIEWCQKTKRKIQIKSFEDTGNQNVKYFSAEVWIDNELIAKGRSTSKKRAEETAAKRAYYVFQDQIK